MNLRYRQTSPHSRQAYRPDRLITAERKRQASVERLPTLLPATCPSCREVLGLVEEDGELLCRDCGVWVPADETLEVVA